MRIVVSLALAVGLAACEDSKSASCPGGCPLGQVCDYGAGRCVELRPPEAPPDLGRYNSAALDSAGRLVVASYAARYGDLVLGRERADGTFGWEYVDGLPGLDDPSLLHDPSDVIPGPDVGLYASLALDPLDRPRVAYFDRTNGRLRYAAKTAEGWRVEEVPQLGSGEHVAGRGASLSLDSQGLPRIAFLDEDLGGVMLARKVDADSWVVEQVHACAPEDPWPGELSAEPGRLISLVLDQRDSELVAFHDVCSGGLELATRTAEGFGLVSLDQGPGAGLWVSAALDGDGRVAVAYHHRGQGTLRYAWSEAGAVKTAEVDPGRRVDQAGAQRRWPVGQHCALAFGNDGLPRILYLDGQGLDLRLAVGLAQGGFAEPEVLDGHQAVGMFNALVRGDQHLRAVSYRVGRDEQGLSAGELAVYDLPDQPRLFGGRRP